MIDFFHDVLGKYTPFILLGLIAIVFIVMMILGLNFG